MNIKLYKEEASTLQQLVSQMQHPEENQNIKTEIDSKEDSKKNIGIAIAASVLGILILSIALVTWWLLQ